VIPNSRDPCSDFSEEFATAPSKPSPQTKFVLDAMEETAATTAAAINELHANLDLLHGRLACVDTTQQQMVAQLDLISTAVQDGAKLHTEAARQQATMEERLAATVKALERLRARSHSREEDDPDPDEVMVMGKGLLQKAHVTWTGDAAGASSAATGGSTGGGDSGSPRDGGVGVLGGGRPGGVGGGGMDGAGVRRNNHSADSSAKHQLKMSFPRFDGENPRIWKDKCLDYFRLFNVNPSLWLVSATLHMDGNAALWLKAYRLRHEVNTWPALVAAVEAKFGADDHRKYMKQLLALKQKGTVEEYQIQFEELSYQIAIQNPNYDEQFYVSQFIRGLKTEIRATVEAQVPETVERAGLLALVQQEVLNESKPWAQRPPYQPRHEQVAHRVEPARPALKMGTGDFWKDRQLRDYRRANNLCFKCGEKFDPTHQCARKPAAELHAMTTEETLVTPEQLSEEVLNMMEMQDLAEATQLSLSLNALAGTDSGDTIRLRAMIGNQVLLVLIDSGSSS
jgi:hypothetical protein